MLRLDLDLEICTLSVPETREVQYCVDLPVNMNSC